MKVLLAGDVHGNVAHLQNVYDAASAAQVDAVLQLGDLALYWPGDTGEKDIRAQASRLATETGIPCYVVVGNHDNHEALAEAKAAAEPTEIADGVWVLPQGHAFTWGSTRCVALGGAVSIDRDSRIIGSSWWPNEAPSTGELYRALEAGTVDVVFSHEAPLGHKVPTGIWGRRPTDRDAYAVRELLEALRCELRPTRWFHGHHHVAYTLTRDGTTITGLGADISAFEDSITIIDL